MSIRKAFVVLVVLAIALVVLGACGKTTNDTQVDEPSEDIATDTTAAEDTSEEAALDDSTTEDLAAQVAGKTWVVLGDSLTEKNFRANMSYYDYVADDLGCVVVNYGASGTGYKEAGPAEPFYERVLKMDVADADCLTVFGSFNDLGKGFELGSAYDETNDTIGGCMALTIQRLRDANPEMVIGIVTPTRWPTGLAYDAQGYYDSNATSREECDAYVRLLKDVAARFELPVLDLYEVFTLDPDDEAQQELYYTEDGVKDGAFVHPNSEGHRLMYPLWREFVIELMTGVSS